MPEYRQAVYVISVAAELAGCHPQTLRIYERKGLLRAGPHRWRQPPLQRGRHRAAPQDPGAHQRGAEPGRRAAGPRTRGPGRGARRTDPGDAGPDRRHPRPVPARNRPVRPFSPSPTPHKLDTLVIKFSELTGSQVNREEVGGPGPIPRHREPNWSRPRMALDPNRWTLKTQEALTNAVEAAGPSGRQPRGDARPPAGRAAPARTRGSSFPSSTRSGSDRWQPAQRGRRGAGQAAGGLRRRQPRWVAQISRILLDGPTRCRAELGDEYLSTEHLLLALADPIDGSTAQRIGVRREQLLDRAAGGPGQPPGHQPEPRGHLPGAREVRPRPHRRWPGRASSTR